MIQADDVFLPGVPRDLVVRRLEAAGGNEVSSGKLSSPESSAALAVNTFGWFMQRPKLLPRFPALQALDWPATQVEVEFCARFPWSGGRHPWLDALVESTNAIVVWSPKGSSPFETERMRRSRQRTTGRFGTTRWVNLKFFATGFAQRQSTFFSLTLCSWSNMLWFSNGGKAKSEDTAPFVPLCGAVGTCGHTNFKSGQAEAPL